MPFVMFERGKGSADKNVIIVTIYYDNTILIVCVFQLNMTRILWIFTVFDIDEYTVGTILLQLLHILLIKSRSL